MNSPRASLGLRDVPVSAMTHCSKVVKLKVKTKNPILIIHMSIFSARGRSKYCTPLPHTCTQPGHYTRLGTLSEDSALPLLEEEAETWGPGPGTLSHLSARSHRHSRSSQYFLGPHSN